jgi:hypothetical protein
MHTSPHLTLKTMSTEGDVGIGMKTDSGTLTKTITTTKEVSLEKETSQILICGAPDRSEYDMPRSVV